MGNIAAKNEKQVDDLRKELEIVLRKLNVSAKCISASSVMTTDGVNIVSVMGEECDSDRFSAMCASLLALAETTAKEINRGKLKQVLVECEMGSMLIVHVGADAVLAVASGPGVNLGMIFMEARKAAEYLLKLL